MLEAGTVARRRAAAGPSLSLTLTTHHSPSPSPSPLNLRPHPDQALQGAKLAAQAGATLAPLAAPAGGKPANPFLGNSHLSEQRA